MNIHINNKQKGDLIMASNFIHIKIDPELKTQLKIEALKENKTLTDLLTELITDYLNEKKNE